MSHPAILPIREDGFPRKKWTVAECRRLTEVGLLEPGKFELIEGEIISTMGQSRLHIFIVGQVESALKAIFGEGHVQTHAPVGIGELDEFSDPEPDAAVLEGTLRDYLHHEPIPTVDVRLVVEVSISTLEGDRTTKARIYARNGVPELWVVAVDQRELIVFRDPTNGEYLTTFAVAESGAVSPLASPGTAIRVADLLP